jgi:dienelactone hydrolase
MRYSIRGLVAAVILFAFVAVPARSQSLPNMALARLGYTVKKRTVNAQGELKDKIDAVDRELAEATRLGKNGEVRRLLAKGMALLNGTAWTDVLDFSNSLVLRSDHVFVDTSKPYTVRLEQIYSPSIELHNVTARVSLRKAAAPGGGLAGGPPPAAEVVKDLGTFDEVGRDLRESPYLMELDLSAVADGAYQVHVEVLDGDRALGSANLRMVALKGLDGALSRIESGASGITEAFRADVLYPLDYIRNVNLGRVDLRPGGQFDLAKELAGAEQTMATAKSGKDPFAGRTGDFKRHYLLADAKEIMPYRMYVPATYNGSRAFPLVVALHGLGGTEDSMFGANYKAIAQAEQRGYIVVAPMGYRVDGFYGYSAAGGANRRAQLSEQDVMEVLQRVRKQYKIDDNRIYLMGHSMGGIGTWALGAKYPAIWAVLAPISGLGNPGTVETMKHIPEVVVHGDADNVVPVNSSRVMVAAMKKLGVDVKYIEVPGGSHTDVPGPNMAAIFDFFDAHRKDAGSTPTSR